MIPLKTKLRVVNLSNNNNYATPSRLVFSLASYVRAERSNAIECSPATTARGLAIPHNSITLHKHANLASQSGVVCVPSKPAPLRKRRPPHQALQEKLAAVTEKMEQMRREMDAAKDNGQGLAIPVTHAPTTTAWDSRGKPRLIQEEGGVRFMDSLLGTVYQEVCYDPFLLLFGLTNVCTARGNKSHGRQGVFSR